MANEQTKKVRGIEVTIREGGFTWMARVRHLGGGGTDYFRFNGRWELRAYSGLPSKVYRKLRAEVREAVASALKG